VPLAIVLFRNKDGGIRDYSKKDISLSERFFFNNHFKIISIVKPTFVINAYAIELFQPSDFFDGLQASQSGTKGFASPFPRQRY